MDNTSEGTAGPGGKAVAEPSADLTWGGGRAGGGGALELGCTLPNLPGLHDQSPDVGCHRKRACV